MKIEAAVVREYGQRFSIEELDLEVLVEIKAVGVCHSDEGVRSGLLPLPLPIDKLVKRFPFSQINEAFEAAASGAVIKPVLMMS